MTPILSQYLQSSYQAGPGFFLITLTFHLTVLLPPAYV